MKKFLKRKIASGSPKAVCASQIPRNAKALIPKWGVLRCHSRNSFSNGTSEVWIGTTISAMMARKSVSRNGKGTQAKPNAARAPSVSGRSVAGIVMIRLFTQAWPIPVAWMTEP